MLRTIITLYKAVFLFWCGFLLLGTLLLGFFIMVEGATPEQRWSGVGMMVSGGMFAIILAGNFALMLENNELLRRIAEQGGRQVPSEPDMGSRSGPRSEPILRR